VRPSCPVRGNAANNCDFRHVAVLVRLFTHRGVPRPTLPFIPPGSVNADQLRPGRQRQIRFMPFVDKHVHWVTRKMCNSLTTRGMLVRSCGEVPSRRGTVSSVLYRYLTFRHSITCAPAMLRADIVFGGVCMSVCPQEISKTTGQKLM